MKNGYRKLCTTCDQYNPPTDNTIICFEIQHSTLDDIRSNRLCPGCSEENLTVVAEGVHTDRGESIQGRSQ